MLDQFMNRNEVGLVSKFFCYANFRDTQKQNSFGYWKFDGDHGDATGEFVSMEEDSNVPEQEALLRQLWDQRVQKKKADKEEHDGLMRQIIQMSPRNLAAEEDEGNNNEGDQAAQGTLDPQPGSNTYGITHAMVMLGCYDDPAEEKRYYMLWNWWSSMPLVLVSFEYLVACHCKVFFLDLKLRSGDILEDEREEALASECTFPEQGENTTYYG